MVILFVIVTFLDNIYVWMPVWLDIANTNRMKTTFWDECREIFIKTWNGYILYSESPLYKRFRVLLKTAVGLLRTKGLPIVREMDVL